MNGKPIRGIDGPSWCYPGDRAILKSTGGRFICTTYESNCMEYGVPDTGDDTNGTTPIAYFKRDPREMRNAPQYEKDRHIGVTPDDVILETQTTLF